MNYAIEIEHPVKGWTRLRARYLSRKGAQSWVSFVKAAWGGLPHRIVPVIKRPRR